MVSCLCHGECCLIHCVSLDKVILEINPIVVVDGILCYICCPIDECVAKLVGDLNLGQCLVQ